MSLLLEEQDRQAIQDNDPRREERDSAAEAADLWKQLGVRDPQIGTLAKLAADPTSHLARFTQELDTSVTESGSAENLRALANAANEEVTTVIKTLEGLAKPAIEPDPFSPAAVMRSRHQAFTRIGGGEDPASEAEVLIMLGRLHRAA